MKRIAFGVATATALTVVAALDNSVVNDFWNTTGYVNGTVAEQSAPLASALDSRVRDVAASNAPAFSTSPHATVIVLR